MANSPPPGAFDPQRAILDRISALETTVRNLANKTLNSASITTGVSGGFDVYAGGVDKLHVGPDQTIMRDQANNIVISDDKVAGWGFTQPNLSIPMYTTSNSAFYFPFSAPAAGTNLAMAAGQAPINNPRVSWFWQVILSTGVAASCTYTFTVAIPGHGTTTLSTLSLSGSTTMSQQNSGTLVYPANYFGLIANYAMTINYTNSGNAGTSFAVVPVYLYGSGA